MAKKRIEQPADDEQDDVEYSDVEPEVVEDEPVTPPRFEPTAEWLAQMEADDVITKPGGPAVSLDTDERTYRVSFALPYGVLVALLDAEHVDADIQGARAFGLLSDKPYSVEQSPNKTVYKYSLTELGQKVLDGIDQTAIRHKMLAAWREQHNRGVDSDKTGFKRVE